MEVAEFVLLIFEFNLEILNYINLMLVNNCILVKVVNTKWLAHE